MVALDPQGPTGPSAISNYSLGSTAGYIVLNNGFKIQWKILAGSSSNTASTITPPINFTTFSWAMTYPLTSNSTFSDSGTPKTIDVARLVGAIVTKSTLNEFYVFNSKNARYVVMLGV